MKQTTYERFDTLVEQNPIAGFYSQLEDIIDTNMPRLSGHKRTVENVYHGLEELKDSARGVLFVEIDGESIQDYQYTVEENEEAIGEYISAIDRVINVTHYLAMQTKQEVNEMYKERCAEIYQEDRELMGSLDHTDFSPEEKKRKEKILDRLSENDDETIKHIGEDFPDNLDYRLVLPAVIRMLKKEYVNFKKNPRDYLKQKNEGLIGEIRKTWAGKSERGFVPLLTPDIPPNTTIH